jgi:phospho-N-acetylmuramoyl-pentapeptide-transferase
VISAQWFLNSIVINLGATIWGIWWLIDFLHRVAGYQPIRTQTQPNEITVDHTAKAKTPTMGGIVIIAVVLFNILVFTNFKSPTILGYILLALSFGFTGFLDDFYKMYYGISDGFRGSKKLIIQLISAATVMILITANNSDYINMPLFIPIINIYIPLDIFSTCFFTVIIAGSANATNITDGLDGLLTVPTIFICLTFIFIVSLDLLGIKNLPIKLDTQTLVDIMVVLLAMSISLFAFLFFNYHPAKIFMGDVGSLFCGAILCYTAIILKIEFLYALTATLFIIEILSSTLQVVYYRISGGKRIFRMAPFHHHLEKGGWSEDRVTFALWSLSFLSCLLGVLMYFIFY